jgi:hypothetical protein
MGWMGLKRELIYTLKTMGADLDELGNVMLFREPPAVGLGGEEVVVPDGCEYAVGGRRRNVASAMGATSYGLRGVKVF